MDELKRILEQLDTAEWMAGRKREALEKEHVTRLKQAAHVNGEGHPMTAVIRAGIDAEYAGKQKAIDDALTAELREIRAGIKAAAARARAALDTELYKAAIAGNPTGDQWREAAVRQDVIREDIERMKPGEITETYERATRAGDAVGAWLYRTLGMADLKRRIDEATGTGQLPGAGVHIALKTLHDAALGDAEREHAAALREIQKLESQAEAARTDAEIAAVVKRYGV